MNAVTVTCENCKRQVERVYPVANGLKKLKVPACDECYESQMRRYTHETYDYQVVSVRRNYQTWDCYEERRGMVNSDFHY